MNRTPSLGYVVTRSQPYLRQQGQQVVWSLPQGIVLTANR